MVIREYWETSLFVIKGIILFYFPTSTIEVPVINDSFIRKCIALCRNIVSLMLFRILTAIEIWSIWGMNLSKRKCSQLLSSGFLKVEMYDNQFIWDIRLKYSWNKIILPLNFQILFMEAHMEDICCLVSF